MGQIDETFGALYIAGTIGMIMYGIFILQTYFYFLHYYNENIRIKLLVVCVFILDTVHSVFVAHSNYFYLISGFEHPDDIKKGIWSLYASTAANVFISLFVKSYYVMQIHLLSKPRWRPWITSFLVTLIVLHFASGVETVAAFFVKGKLASLRFTRPSSFILLTTNLATDFVIAIFLCVMLGRRRPELPEAKINFVINNLIVFCVQRFLLCLAIGVVQLVTLMTLPQSLYAAAIGIVFGKLYTNSLLATLNSRRYIGGRGGRREQSTTTVTTTTSYPLDSPARHSIVPTYLLDTEDNSRSAIDVDLGLRTCDLEDSIMSHKS